MLIAVWLVNVSIATARTQSTVVLDRASGFATMASGLTIIQMLFTVRQVQHTGRLGEVSMWAIALQSLLDAYLVRCLKVSRLHNLTVYCV